MGNRFENKKQVMIILNACGWIMWLSKIIIMNTNNEKIIGWKIIEIIFAVLNNWKLYAWLIFAKGIS